jgi:hypothetical protein
MAELLGAVPERWGLVLIVVESNGSLVRVVEPTRVGPVRAARSADLLEDPSAEALVEWLGGHAGVEIICRDRDGVYANAARRGAPKCAPGS